MTVVADTHTFIWYLRGSNRLSDTALNVLDQTIQNGNLIYIVSISLIEIAYLVEKTRIPEAAFEQLNQALADPNTSFRVVPLDLVIAQTIRQIDRATVPEMPEYALREPKATHHRCNCPLPESTSHHPRP
jgi:PIN domain nuclease of toxin-antitoxin system